MWCALAAIALGLNVFAVVAFGVDGASRSDLISANIVGAAVAATMLAVSTSRMVLEERVLIAVTTLRSLTIRSEAIAAIEDSNGLAIRTRNGRRLVMAICEPSVAQSLIGNRRRVREAAVIRDWADRLNSESRPGLPSLGWTAAPRWAAIIGIPTWTLVSTLSSLLLFRTLGPAG